MKTSAQMECPKCMGELREKTIGEKQGKKIAIDQCFGCAGIWFDQNELRQTLKLKLEFDDQKEAKDFYGERRDIVFDLKAARCPVCKGNMKRLKLAEGNPLVVDHCGACDGVWLDGGEIRLLMSGRPLRRALDLLMFQVKDFFQKRPLSKSLLKRSKV